MARPQASFGEHEAYPDIVMKAAVLLHSLVKNHGFVDGNKRTGIVACGTFLILNGHQVRASQKDLVDFTLSIAEDLLVEEAIARWLEEHTAVKK